MAAYQFVLNGTEVDINVPGNTTLLEVLRRHLGLTATKEACGKGECGACTVLLDGEAVNACLLLMPQVAGHQVVTLEGLAISGELEPLQQAFIDAGAVQCGYCTPGMILSAKALLDHHPKPKEQEIRLAISGNLCRCTGYSKIVQAIRLASVATERG